MKNIINIINFARGVEPRVADDSYLLPTLEEELKLCRRYGFKSTVLLQYDCLIDERYRELVKEYSDIAEVGLWLEIVQPLVEKAGLEWHGRYPWDWHNDVGFTVGYTPDERRRLMDTAFEDFKGFFGTYPCCAGCWHIDAFSLNYINEKYNPEAFCICKEQYGTDGYTLWGGYYSGAYYPSKSNMLCPAQSEETQINLPVFRMLGSDPVYQYELGIDNRSVGQSVSSLEPVYGNSGRDPDWVKWFLKENFNGKGLALSYAQAGQENSFGWKDIKDGLEMQFELFKKAREAGIFEILTLSESGKWFKSSFASTPASAVCCDSSCTDKKTKTVWYNCKKYRINLHFNADELRIRDVYIFNDLFKEPYLNKRDTEKNCAYYNLPLIDGFRFSKSGLRAGIYFRKSGKPVKNSSFESTANEKKAAVKWGEDITVTADENGFSVLCSEDTELEFVFARVDALPYKSADGKTLYMTNKCEDGTAFDYTAKLESGSFIFGTDNIKVRPENGLIRFSF